MIFSAVHLFGRVKFPSWDETAYLVLSWSFVYERPAGKSSYRCLMQDEQGEKAEGTLSGVVSFAGT